MIWSFTSDIPCYGLPVLKTRGDTFPFKLVPSGHINDFVRGQIVSLSMKMGRNIFRH